MKSELFFNYAKGKPRLTYFVTLALITCILLTSTGQTIIINKSLAQISPIGQLNQSAVIFRNVSVDGNPGPNKPFKVNASISVSDILPRHVLLSLNVPPQISILGSSIVDLGDVSSHDTAKSSFWTLVAGASGSFPLNITAYSSSISISNVNNNFQTTSFPFDVSIGSQIVTSVRPLNILLAGTELTSSLVGPGDKNLPLNITLANDGTLPVSDVTATLELSEPFYWSYKQNGTNTIETHSESFHSGIVPERQSMVAPYYLSVRNSAVPDTYMNHLRVSFYDGKQQHQMVYNLPISISSNTAVAIVAHVTKLVPDYYTPISFDIVNKGGVPLHALQVSSIRDSSTTTASAGSILNPLSTSSPASASASSIPNPYYTVGTPYWIGDLAVGEAKGATIQVYVPHEILAQTPLPITLTYEANGKHVSETHLIGVQIQGRPTFQVQMVRVVPPLAFPGDVNTRVDVNLINAGFGIANNVSTILNLPRGLTPAFGNANTEYFGRILPNQNFTASYFLNIDPSATTSNHPLTVSVQYYNNKFDNGKSVLNANFLVSPKAHFDLIGIAGSSQLYPGATNVPIKVTLKNTGTATAQTIATKFLGGNSIPGIKSPLMTAVGNTENVGNILPGQFFTSTFVVNVDPATSQAGQQVASIEIDWTQSQTSGTSLTNNFIQTLPITYDVAQGPSYLLYYSGIPWTYIIIGVLLATLVVVFVVLRRRRMRMMGSYSHEQQQPPPRIAAEDTKVLEQQQPPPRIAVEYSNNTPTYGQSEKHSPSNGAPFHAEK